MTQPCNLSLNDRNVDWEKWHKDVQRKGSPWLKYDKSSLPPTVSKEFRIAKSALAKLMKREKNFFTHLSILIFMKEHPKINNVLFEYAAVENQFDQNFEKYSLHNVLSPLEVLKVPRKC